MSELSPRERRIFVAVRELIDEAGGCEGAAVVLDLKKSQVGRMRVDPPEVAMSLFQKSKLEAFVGKPIVTRAEAAMLGFDLVSDSTTMTNACLSAAISLVMGEAADLAKTHAELVPDGLSSTDASLLENELRDVARKIEHARQICAVLKTKTNHERSA